MIDDIAKGLTVYIYIYIYPTHQSFEEIERSTT